MKKFLMFQLFALSLVVVGCSSLPVTQVPVPSAVPLATQVPTEKPTTPPVATIIPTQTSAPTGNEQKIDIKGFAYNPEKVTIKAGTTVIWTNQDSNTHTVAGDDDKWGSGNLEQGEQFKFTFETPGTYTYHCGFHQAMKGAIIVE